MTGSPSYVFSLLDFTLSPKLWGQKNEQTHKTKIVRGVSRGPGLPGMWAVWAACGGGSGGC